MTTKTAKPAKTPADMTDAEFERYLKRNDMTGLAAVRAAAKRREAIAARAAA